MITEDFFMSSEGHLQDGMAVFATERRSGEKLGLMDKVSAVSVRWRFASGGRVGTCFRDD